MLRQKIRRTRMYSCVKQQDMSKMLGVSNSCYCKMERGDLNFDFKYINKIAKILMLDENELITYWIADKIYKLSLTNKELALDAIEIVRKHIDDYETLIITPEQHRQKRPNQDVKGSKKKKNK